MKSLGASVPKNPALFWTGAAHLFLVPLFLLLAAADGRTLSGVNLWIKPLKFALSIGVYAWTLAWMLERLGDARWTKRVSPWVAALLTLEMLAIGGQAARGAASHFNVSTPFDGAVYGLMGAAIAVSTTLVGWTGVKFLRRRPSTAATDPISLGAGLGLVFGALFSFEGFVMGARLAHTVGAPDGGPGLPLLNWSHAHGDLRIAHFLGIHAMQVMPMIGWWTVRTDGDRARTWTLSLSFAYAGLCLAAFLWAMAGRGFGG